MSKAEQDKYLTKKAIAVFPMSNWGGIEILEIQDDYVVYRFNFGEPKEAHTAKIIYGKRDRFRTCTGYSVHLDDCMRI